MRIFRKLKKLFYAYRNRIMARGKVKYFCIGRNKTGTTSLRKAFEDLGFSIGDQRKAELLADKYYFSGNFAPIVEYCKSAQVFQDVPFSWPDTYKYVDKAYPGSKYILTIRDTEEQWYRSITAFHAKRFGNGTDVRVEDLRSAKYVRKGFMYHTVSIHGTSDHDPYNKEIMINHYQKYNEAVLEYFKGRPDDLLVINVADPGAYKKFCDFVGVATGGQTTFPWENKT